MAKYLSTTQGIANNLPGYMRGRSYKYSVYQQLMNMYNIQFEQMNYALHHHLANRHFQTYMFNTIDRLHTIRAVPATFDHVSNAGLTKSPCTNYEDWWYNLEGEVLPEILESGIQPVTVFSGALSTGLTLNNTLLKKHPSKLYFTLNLTDVLNPAVFTHVDIAATPQGNTRSYATSFIITGLDIRHRLVEETISFSMPGMMTTSHRYKQVNSITPVLWDAPGKLTLEIASTCSPVKELGYLDPYPLSEYFDENGSKVPFWNVVQLNSKWYLTLNSIAAASSSEYNSGNTATEIIKKWLLQDENATNLTAVTSLLPSAYDDNIYVSAGTKVYLYSKHEDMPTTIVEGTAISIVQEAGAVKTPDPLVYCSVEVWPDEVVIKGTYNKVQVLKSITGYRFTIKTGSVITYWNGTAFVAEDPGFTAYDLGSSIGFYSPVIHYPITDLGAFTVTLEVRLAISGKIVIETDNYIVPAQYKAPLAFATTGSPITSLHYGLNDTLAIKAGDFLSYTRLTPKTYFYDPALAVLLFPTSHTGIVLKNASDTTLETKDTSTINIFNELDQHAAMFQLKRADRYSGIMFIPGGTTTSLDPGNSYEGASGAIQVFTGTTKDMSGLESSDISLKVVSGTTGYVFIEFSANGTSDWFKTAPTIVNDGGGVPGGGGFIRSIPADPSNYVYWGLASGPNESEISWTVAARFYRITYFTWGWMTLGSYVRTYSGITLPDISSPWPSEDSYSFWKRFDNSISNPPSGTTKGLISGISNDFVGMGPKDTLEINLLNSSTLRVTIDPPYIHYGAYGTVMTTINTLEYTAVNGYGNVIDFTDLLSTVGNVSAAVCYSDEAMPPTRSLLPYDNCKRTSVTSAPHSSRVELKLPYNTVLASGNEIFTPDFPATASWSYNASTGFIDFSKQLENPVTFQYNYLERQFFLKSSPVIIHPLRGAGDYHMSVPLTGYASAAASFIENLRSFKWGK